MCTLFLLWICLRTLSFTGSQSESLGGWKEKVFIFSTLTAENIFSSRSSYTKWKSETRIHPQTTPPGSQILISYMRTSLFSFLVIPTVVLIIGVTDITENILWINKDSKGYVRGIIFIMSILLVRKLSRRDVK